MTHCQPNPCTSQTHLFDHAKLIPIPQMDHLVSPLCLSPYSSLFANTNLSFKTQLGFTSCGIFHQFSKRIHFFFFLRFVFSWPFTAYHVVQYFFRSVFFIKFELLKGKTLSFTFGAILKTQKMPGLLAGIWQIFVV